MKLYIPTPSTPNSLEIYGVVISGARIVIKLLAKLYIKFVLTDATIATWVSLILFIGLLVILCSKLKVVPDTKQTVLELLVDLIISSAMGFGLNRKQAEKIAPTIGTFGIVIMACNVSSLFKLSPPAKNIAFPVALAIVAIIYVIGVSISMVGIKGFWSSLIHPMPAMLPGTATLWWC